MKKYVQESKISIGYLKHNSKKNIFDIKPIGLVHTLVPKQVQIGQKESTAVSDYLASCNQDAMNIYYMKQSQIINQNRKIDELFEKRLVIARKIDEINKQLKDPDITENQQIYLYDIKRQYKEQIEQYIEQIEQLQLNEKPEIMKKIQELTNALTQSETQKQVLTKEIQEKDIVIAAFNKISQMLPSLQASVDQMPALIENNEELQRIILENEQYIVSVEQALKGAQTELPVLQNKIAELEVANQQIPELQAQIEMLQTANAMGVLGRQEPNVEPNIIQDLESKLKLKGEIKGDMRMFKMGKKLELPDDKIKELFIKVEKFEDIKGYFINHPERLLVENGYESEDISLIMGESN